MPPETIKGKSYKNSCFTLILILFLFLNITTATSQHQTSEISFLHISDSISTHKVDSILNHIGESNLSDSLTLAILHQLQEHTYDYNLIKQYGLSCFELAIRYKNSEYVDSIKNNLNRALIAFEETKDRYHEMLTIKEQGHLFRRSEQLDKCVERYTKALKIAEELDLQNDIGVMHSNFGNIYYDSEDYEKALNSYKRALDFDIKCGTKVIILHNIGMNLRKLDSLDLAKDYQIKSIEQCHCTDDPLCGIYQKNEIGSIYRYKGDYAKAIDYYKEVVKQCEDNNANFELLVTLNELGLIALEEQNFNDAESYFLRTLELVKVYLPAHIFKIHSNLVKVYRGNNDYKKALEHMMIFSELGDSLMNVEKKQITQDLLAQYETEKKEKEIEILQKEKDLQDAAINKQQAIQYLTIIIGLLVIFILTAIVLIYKQRLNTREKLAVKNDEINRQQTLELIKRHEIASIRATINGQEMERKRVSQELHDGVAGTLAGIKLNLRTLAEHEAFSPRLIKAIDSIDTAYDEVRTISHNLKPTFVEQSVFYDMLNDYFRDIEKSTHLSIGFQVTSKEALELLPDTIKIELYRISQEVLTNVIKHAQAETVKIMASLESGLLQVSFEDDGIGFNIRTSGIGIGLYNIQSRINTLKGELDIESNIDIGTAIRLKIPLGMVKDLVLEEK